MKKTQLHFFWKDRMSMTIAGTIAWVGIKYGEKVIGASSYKEVIIWGKGTFFDVYMKEKFYRQTVAESKKMLIKKNAEYFFKNSKIFRKKFDRFIEKINRANLALSSNGDLARIIEKLNKLEIEGVAHYSQSQDEPMNAAKSRMKKILANNFLIQEISSVFETLITPVKFDKAQEQEVEWLRILFRNKKFTLKVFEDYCKKYPFMFRNSFDLKKSFEYFRKRFAEEKKSEKKIISEINRLKLRKNTIYKIQKEIFKKISSKELRYLSWLFQNTAIERMNLKHIWAGVEEILAKNLYQEVAKRINVNWVEMIKYFRMEEMIDALDGKKSLSSVEISKRKKAIFIEAGKRNVKLYSGEEAILAVDKKYPQLRKKITRIDIKGTIASSGRATGRVCIVMSEGFEDLAKIDEIFKKGQILVTGMTQPNMIPLMKKAGAIITDEGGLTSHAAVISRELKKPCIVGVQVATNILKDGDLVEVDANRGTVKLIDSK